ncbi:DUF1194 domain-containing protein [Yoonia sp. 2307UL14-13]|uniref:DUF1194 domain-containing protein n=1 Tax=Yoonia sp. 2307UL14-13 TaxID=3126506 RepID=UPI0030A89893
MMVHRDQNPGSPFSARRIADVSPTPRRAVIRRLTALGATLLTLLPPLAAHAACRQALALGLDVSGSVDGHEYRLQLDGLATALSSPKVQEALLAQPDAPVRITVYEWSGPRDQNVILPWLTINDINDLNTAIGALTAHRRQPAAPTTAIGAALLAGFALLREQGTCWRRTLDISGDGPANTGPRPQDIDPARQPRGVIVNGLVVGSGDLITGDNRFADIKELSSYYRRNVIRGPGAFVETALGFEDYAAAMERKLLRELRSLAIGAVDGDTPIFPMSPSAQN